MSKKILSVVVIILLAIILVVLQFSLISALPYPWYNINLLIVSLILVFLISSKEQAWLLALSLGYFSDLLSFQPYGAAIISLFFSAVIVYLILENWLTNRSLYSFLLLAVIGIVSERFIYYLFVFIFDWSGRVNGFFLFKAVFWESLAWSILAGLLIVIFSFHFLVLLSRKLQPFFLSKK